MPGPREPAHARAAARPAAGRLAGVSTQAIEIFFLVLLILASITIAWFSVYVVYRLFKGQR